MTFDLDALETSLDLVSPHGSELMDAFFAQRPFPAGDAGAQRTMTLRLMGLLRLCLHDAHAVVALVRDLGARHGARPEQYLDVGAALITAMAKVAGDSWQPRYDRAWTAAVSAVVAALGETAPARGGDPTTSLRRRSSRRGAGAGRLVACTPT